MPPDIALLWYGLDDNSMHATRSAAAACADELELPWRISDFQHTPAHFERSCQETSMLFEGPFGEVRRAQAVQVGSKVDSTTYEVRRDSVRLIQVRYFHPRRTETGTVRGSARVKTIVSSQLDDHDAAGAREWIKQFEDVYDVQQQLVTWKVVRRVAKASLIEIATPVFDRKWLYFGYTDNLDMAARLRTFLSMAAASSSVTVVPVDPSADPELFVRSADIDMAERLQNLNDRLAIHQHGHRLVPTGEVAAGYASKYRYIAERTARHQQKLEADLPATSAALDRARELMLSADPSGDLLQASVR